MDKNRLKIVEFSRLGCECPEPGYCYTIEHGGYKLFFFHPATFITATVTKQEIKNRIRNAERQLCKGRNIK